VTLKVGERRLREQSGELRTPFETQSACPCYPRRSPRPVKALAFDNRHPMCVCVCVGGGELDASASRRAMSNNMTRLNPRCELHDCVIWPIHTGGARQHHVNLSLGPCRLV